MQSIYRFYVDCGRHGRLEGKLVATAEDIAFAAGKQVYFEEPWGKHSSCDATLTAGMFTIVSSDPADVATFDRLCLSHGHDPLGLLYDSIYDGRVVLSDADKAAAPERFKSAIR